MFHVPEKFRMIDGPLPSTKANGNNGVFIIKTIKLKRTLRTIVSQGEGWEHVSVSLVDRCPTWEEMCIVKDMFWDADDFVVQMHVPKSDYINCHPYCLHLWRKQDTNDFCERPPKIFVGP